MRYSKFELNLSLNLIKLIQLYVSKMTNNKFDPKHITSFKLDKLFKFTI